MIALVKEMPLTIPHMRRRTDRVMACRGGCGNGTRGLVMVLVMGNYRMDRGANTCLRFLALPSSRSRSLSLSLSLALALVLSRSRALARSRSRALALLRSPLPVTRLPRHHTPPHRTASDSDLDSHRGLVR